MRHWQTMCYVRQARAPSLPRRLAPRFLPHRRVQDVLGRGAAPITEPTLAHVWPIIRRFSSNSALSISPRANRSLRISMALEAVSRVVSYARVSRSRWARQPPQHQHMSRLRLSRSLISHKISHSAGRSLRHRPWATRVGQEAILGRYGGHARPIGSAILFTAAGRNGVKRPAALHPSTASASCRAAVTALIPTYRRWRLCAHGARASELCRFRSWCLGP